MSIHDLMQDDVCAVLRKDNDGTREFGLKAVCKFAAQHGKLDCLKWAYMRAGVSKNELLPFTTQWPECRRWLLDH